MSSVTHEWLSRRLFLPLADVRQAVRAETRHTLRAYREGMRFRRETLSWDDDRRRAWVLARLRSVTREAARETPYYRAAFERAGFDGERAFSFDEFAEAPILDRDDLGRAGASIVSTAVPPERLVKQSTGGSTGAPAVVWLGPEERGWSDSGMAFSLSLAGAPPGASIGYLWGHHLDPVARQSWRQRLQDFQANVRWFDCFRISGEILDAYHAAFERWRPRCIVAYASALAALAEHVLENGYTPSYPTRSFVTGAEKLLPAQRERIEEAFGRPIHERYGSRDVGSIAFQRDPERTLELEVDWVNVLVEPESVEGDASILVTKLHADGMPMIRYRIGDLGRFVASARPGHPAFALTEVTGREIDRIWLPDGRWVSGAEIPHLMKDHPVREFAFRQRSDYSLEILVAPATSFGDEDRGAILGTVSANLPGLPLELVLVDEIPRTAANKLRPVVSDVTQDVRDAP